MNCGKTPRFLSSFNLRPTSSSGATGMSAFPSRRSRGFDPHFELRRGKSGTCWVLLGDSAFLWSGDGYLRKLLRFHKGCQVSFLLPRGNVGFLRKHCSIKGPHLAWRGEFHGFCGVVVGSSRLLSSCMGTWGTRSCFLREVRSTFELRGGTSGFLLHRCTDE